MLRGTLLLLDSAEEEVEQPEVGRHVVVAVLFGFHLRSLAVYQNLPLRIV